MIHLYHSEQVALEHLPVLHGTDAFPTSLVPCMLLCLLAPLRTQGWRSHNPPATSLELDCHSFLAVSPHSLRAPPEAVGHDIDTSHACVAVESPHNLLAPGGCRGHDTDTSNACVAVEHPSSGVPLTTSSSSVLYSSCDVKYCQLLGLYLDMKLHRKP